MLRIEYTYCHWYYYDSKTYILCQYLFGVDTYFLSDYNYKYVFILAIGLVYVSVKNVQLFVKTCKLVTLHRL